MSLIQPVASLSEFFSDLLTHALDEEDIRVETSTREYLVQVLEDYAQADALHAEGGGLPTLFELYRDASESGPTQRFEAFRRLGDTALLVSGLFSPHLERERSTVGVDYYVDMGRAAYDSAARHTQAVFQSMFFELAMKFARIVEVLTRVAEETTLPVRKDLANLYERMLRNPESQALNRRLLSEGAGVVFVPQKAFA